MKKLMILYLKELKDSLKILLGGITLILFLFLFSTLISRKIFPVDLTINIFYLIFSINLITLTGLLVIKTIKKEWTEKTGYLTFTLPLPKWSIFLTKMFAILTYDLLFSITFFVSFWGFIQFKVHHSSILPGSINTNQNIIPVSAVIKNIFFVEYLQTFINSTIPLIIAIIGMSLLAYTLYRIVPFLKLPTGLTAFFLPLYIILQLMLHLDQQVVGHCH